ncbi:MAG: malto-oligosyltrehalose trehalohydrolase [Ornithinimicrobium sp.]|uniref:malto-oligosyltrehalose trehalohydrolase n=1 Tax=Ornithinimicrobium sp. TaxID=1977084 RepID=UPI0026DF7793|nr:malto-oligosyltrehalose trehalohydrolase [Ornithinimicrobium sp.]MDO5740270.1 malto-oligosyltrehalose trehalohydrolase [Ornithinimicrobium sp.]
MSAGPDRVHTGAHTFRLWAPEAGTVDLRRGADHADSVPMAPGEGGWWEVRADAGDARYAYSIDGRAPVPDPRSRHQPDGVHAASALVDTTAFTWTDQGWGGVHLDDAVIYELHVGTFTPQGTFDGVIEHLDHLLDLGVNVIELMPVAAFPGRRGWGYDGVGLYAVHEAYGGPAGLARLVDAAHANGLAVWLDVVYNHLGPSGNYLGQVAPYFTDRHHTPWGEAVNLDGPGSDEVRAFVLDNLTMWLTDYHLDGLRLDAVHALHDERATPLVEELAARADEITASSGIPRTLVAESDRNDPSTVVPRSIGGAGGMGLHGQWADDIHHALHVSLTGEAQGYYADFADPGALPKVLADTPFFHDGSFSTFRGRVHGRPVDPDLTPGWHYIASLQTHDQIGNRALGERLGHLVTPGVAAVGAALLLTSPYTPMLFMGEEWGASTPWQYFTDHEEAWLAESIRVGRQAEFAAHGWAEEVPDPQDAGTASASVLRWDEVHEGGHGSLLQWYRTLIRLRREQPALRSTPLGAGKVWREPLPPEEGSGELIMVERGDVRVLAHLGQRTTATATTEVSRALPEGAEMLASFGEVSVSTSGTQGRLLRCGADSVAVLAGWGERHE